MKLKQIIGVVLMIFMGKSLWDKLQDSLSGTDEPLAMGALIMVIILMVIVLVVRVLRTD